MSPSKPQPSGKAITEYRESHKDENGKPMSLEKFGKPLGVWKSVVHRWESGLIAIPAERCVQIQEIYPEIEPYMLRPDLWDPPEEDEPPVKAPKKLATV